MTLPALTDKHSAASIALDARISWFDSDPRCTMVVSTPSADPTVWADYVDGALRSYHRHGIERALDIDSLLDVSTTQLFHAAVNEDGKDVGRLRATGPIESSEQSHAIIEWAGRPGLDTVRKMITDRLPFGVVEM